MEKLFIFPHLVMMQFLHQIQFDDKRRCNAVTLVLLMSVSLSSHAGPIGHAPSVGESLDGKPCAEVHENFGPYDYLSRKILRNKLGIVEKYHFTTNVEQLIAPVSARHVLAEISYTLRAWPNHHRALNSMIRHRVRTWGSNPKEYRIYSPAECWLQRAIKFSPKDATVYMLYGVLLHRTNHKNKALKQYEIALNIDPSNVQTKYNLGLLLVDLKQYHRAKEYAQELYSRGFPLPGLKDKLKNAGKWD